jgi:hypothetical protein
MSMLAEIQKNINKTMMLVETSQCSVLPASNTNNMELLTTWNIHNTNFRGGI